MGHAMKVGNGFDPFTATLEEAKAQPFAFSGRGAVAKWGAAGMLTERRTYYEANVLEAVAWCAVHELSMPEWLVSAYLKAYRKVQSCQVATWDAAFGPAFPKGAKLPQLRLKRANMAKVVNLVRARLAQNPSTPINRNLFEEVGEKLNIGGSSAERLYYEGMRKFGLKSRIT